MKRLRYMVIVSAIALILVGLFLSSCAATVDEGNQKRGNSSGNISNHGSVVQAGDDIYYASWGIFKTGKEDKAVKISDVSAGYLNYWEGRLYFKNYDDGGMIYSCAVDGSDLTEVNAERDGSFLNIVDGKLYFYSDAVYDISGIYTCNVDGSDLRMITTDRAGYMTVYGGRIFFANKLDNFKLYSMNLNGEDRRVLDNSVVTCIIAQEGMIYYGKSDGIYRMKANGAGAAQKLNNIPATAFIVRDGKIFHTDSGIMTDGVPSTAGIYRTIISSGETEEISSSSCASLYSAGDHIYMLAMSEYGEMYRFDADGKALEQLPVGTAP